ncbi:MAG TPA: outer membrane protein assembly factor BamE [Candidatus Binatia bacterium]|nr:outer membrane protein assembly factor BamE [Candidatus Binatia bacterium]
MRSLLVLSACAALCACGLVYKLETKQGNVIEQKQLDRLEVGMSRDQVKFLLGTPIAASVFRDDRWDYAGYYKNPRGKVYSRTVSLFFEGDKLSRMEGAKVAADVNATPDLEKIQQQEKKDKTDAERAGENKDTGIVIQPR